MASHLLDLGGAGLADAEDWRQKRAREYVVVGTGRGKRLEGCIGQRLIRGDLQDGQ